VLFAETRSAATLRIFCLTPPLPIDGSPSFQARFFDFGEYAFAQDQIEYAFAQDSD
jgi:hypothetical protein